MFMPARILMAVLIFAFATLLLFSRFHHVFFVAAAEANAQVKAAERLPPDPLNDYSVTATAAAAPAADPVLPDVSQFTTKEVAALSPAFRSGKVEISPMRSYAGLGVFLKRNGDLQRLRLAQRRTSPRAIVVSGGNYDFTHLFQAVNALSPGESAMRHEGNVYTLRLPLFIAAGASLTISDRDLAELRLSRERGAFIANAGDLFLLRTNITGWSETQGAPSLIGAESSFRPFIATWSGSRLYVAGSGLSNLGYRKGEAHGLVFAACRDCLKQNHALPKPSGAVVDSVFTDMYEGLHVREADGVAVVGNRFANSIYSGINLQGPVRRLIIVDNEIAGTRQSHGIVLSGDVGDSWILRNSIHDSHGSGLVLERGSMRNVIADNVCARNGGDGIALYESSSNRTLGNVVFRNGASGLRVRNSVNISSSRDYIVDNAGAPFVVYTARAPAGEKIAAQEAAARVSGAVLRPRRHRAVFKLDGANNLVLSDVRVLSANPPFADNIFVDSTKISAALTDPGAQVVVSAARDSAKTD